MRKNQRNMNYIGDRRWRWLIIFNTGKDIDAQNSDQQMSTANGGQLVGNRIKL